VDAPPSPLVAQDPGLQVHQPRGLGLAVAKLAVQKAER
jgi:hypothetical protein